MQTEWKEDKGDFSYIFTKQIPSGDVSPPDVFCY